MPLKYDQLSVGMSGGVSTSGVRPLLKDLLQTTVLGSVVECLVSNSSNTSGSTVGSTLNFISPLLGSGGFYLYFGFFSTSPQDWVLDHHKVPLTSPNSYTTLQRSTDNFFLSCTVYWQVYVVTHILAALTKIRNMRCVHYIRNLLLCCTHFAHL